MLLVHVNIHVNPDAVDAFIAATVENAQHSNQEPGIAGFYLIQHQDDPSRFVLVECYRTPEAPGAHKETPHYAKWRDTVAPMMAEPRSSIKYSGIFPAGDEGW